MAVIIGGTPEFPGKNNKLTGTLDPDIIFGDRFTTGAADFFFDPDIPDIGGILSS